jgi:large subunit ribosomal protein L28
VIGMSKVCDICGKGKHVGGSITRRGMAKKKGGIGTHVVKNVKRTFSPNLQRVRVNRNGTVSRLLVCASCIRSNRITKA